MQQFVTTNDFRSLNIVPADKLPALVDSVNQVLQNKIGTGTQWDEFIAEYGTGTNAQQQQRPAKSGYVNQ